MLDFTFKYKPTIHFGVDSMEKLPLELHALNTSKVLLVYGMGSVKKNGILDEVMSKLKEFEVFELSGVMPNPDIVSVREGVEICRKEDIDFILAVGGGSVIDAAKGIACSVHYKGDAWDLIGSTSFEHDVLPIGTVLTLAATGSENNGNSILSNRELNAKAAIRSPQVVPMFSIMNPAFTLSVNQYHTVAGSIDIIMHALEQYFDGGEINRTIDYMTLGLVKSVIDSTNSLLNDLNNLEDRANIMWASSLALNGLLTTGKLGDWSTHNISYTLTADYEITHGLALAIVFPSWLRVFSEKYDEKLKLMGTILFGDESDSITRLEHVFETWMSTIEFSVPYTLEDCSKIAKKITSKGLVGNILKSDYNEILEVLELRFK